MNLSVTRATKSQSDTLEKMERMPETWIEHQNQQNMLLPEAVIQKKVVV
jgi:hypothetical protein